MTPATFQAIRQSMAARGIDDRALAALICVNPDRAGQTFSDWKHARRTIDPARAKLLRAYADGALALDWVPRDNSPDTV
jgi:hypothetical protein